MHARRESRMIAARTSCCRGWRSTTREAGRCSSTRRRWPCRMWRAFSIAPATSPGRRSRWRPSPTSPMAKSRRAHRCRARWRSRSSTARSWHALSSSRRTTGSSSWRISAGAPVAEPAAAPPSAQEGASLGAARTFPSPGECRGSVGWFNGARGRIGGAIDLLLALDDEAIPIDVEGAMAQIDELIAGQEASNPPDRFVEANQALVRCGTTGRCCRRQSTWPKAVIRPTSTRCSPTWPRRIRGITPPGTRSPISGRTACPSDSGSRARRGPAISRWIGLTNAPARNPVPAQLFGSSCWPGRAFVALSVLRALASPATRLKLETETTAERPGVCVQQSTVACPTTFIPSATQRVPGPVRREKGA